MSRATCALFVAVISAGALPLPAEAHSETARDGNDRPGRLDIRSAAVAHEGESVRHTITTFGSWGSALVGQRTPHYLALALDLRGNPSPERFVLLVSRSGKMRAPYLNLRGVVLDQLPVSRPNGRSVSVSIPEQRLDDAGGYRWIALSRYRMHGQDVFDFSPDRRPRLHDLVAPTVRMVTFPDPSTVQSHNHQFWIKFVTDEPVRSAGARWRLERRLVESPTWEVIDSDPGTADPTLNFDGEEGANYVFRVIASDRHGNVTVSPERHVSVPLDDMNPAFAGAFTGTWVLSFGSPAFQSSLRTTTVAGSQFTYTFSGSYVAWIAPGAPNALPGPAAVTIDGGPPVTVDPSVASGDRAVVYEAGGLDPAVPHTIVITHQTGTIHVDGLVAR